MASMKPLPKFVLIVAAVGAVGYGAFRAGLMPSAKAVPATTPPRAELPMEIPQARPAQVPPSATLPQTAVQPASFPSSGATQGPIRFDLWAWNAQMGLMYANGGQTTAPGSLMAKNGVKLILKRNDDVAQMQANLVACAEELRAGAADCASGTHFVAIMGDGTAAFFAGVNQHLKELGPDLIAQVVGSAGYSRGEDKFMGLATWKQDPQKARGALVAGYLRDGDWNIAMKWAGDNDLPNNPDEKTYDPEAINWVAANDYIDAAQKYVAGYCESRAVVRKGVRTGSTSNVCVNGVVTWTPGDVIVAQRKGGLVPIASTKEYPNQMPNTIIGIKRWMLTHRQQVEGMLSAIFEGGEKVKSDPTALDKASEISDVVYHEPNTGPAYWKKYYKGVVEKDKAGISVPLGGSTVNTLSDNLLLFGLDGGLDYYKATYEVFGNIVVNQYPNLVPSYPSISEIEDASYVQNISRKMPQILPAAAPTFNQQDVIKTVVSKKSWYIQFDTGKATLKPEAEHSLQEMAQQLAVAGSLLVGIEGHTDNSGSDPVNKALSEQRAFAVKTWLQDHYQSAFPDGRLRVSYFGASRPKAPNSTEDGRAKNRRVDIVLGATS